MTARLILLSFFALLAHNGSAQLTVKDSMNTRVGIYSYVEQMPSAGYSIPEYLSNNIKYPLKAQREKVEGRVLVKFVVNEDGSISDAKILNGIGGGCDEEALRVVAAMPSWKKPGIKDGKAVSVYFTVPINFNLKR